MKINTKSLKAIIKEELKALQQKKLISESGLHPEHPAMKAITEAFKIFRSSRPEDKGSIKQAMRDILAMMERSALQESNMGAAHVEIQNDVQALIEKHREHGLDLKGLVAIIGDMDMDTAAPAEEDPMAAMERHMTGGLQQDRY